MISIHTFEFRTALSKAEQKKLKKKLDIPATKQNWTEHRYSDKGIQIILYTGKKKKFIYLKYIVNIQRLFNKNDYLHLLKPTNETIACAWQTIRQTWAEIGCGIPFESFHLSRLDFTCDIRLESEGLVQEYIRLLSKSILLSTKRFSVDGIHYGKKIPDDERVALQQNCCKYEITACENIQCYNKIYELENENLPIPKNILTEDTHILRIELQIHKTKRITELLQSFNMQSKPIEEQFDFFIRNADYFLLNRLEKLFMPGKYHKKTYITNFINHDFSIRNKSRKQAIRLLNDCNKNVPLGRCLAIDYQNGNPNKRKKSLEYLSANSISPILISTALKEYDELPDIFELLATKSD